ncbi:MAG: ABC transporter substrate-binding protein [Minicystis sp.]
MPARLRLFPLAALLFAACSSTPPAATTPVAEVTAAPQAAPPAAPAPAAKTWKIGAYLSLSGPDAAFGMETREGIDLAIDDVNARGGVKGRKLEVVFADDKSNPQATVDAVLRLIDASEVVALLGEVASSRSKAGGIVASKRGVPMITPASTNPDVTRIGPFVFRACFDDAVQGKAAARYVVQSAPKKRVALLTAADDLYSSTLASAFREEVARLGAPLTEVRFSRREADLTAAVQAIAREKPSLVYAPVYYDVMPAIVKAAKAAGLRGDQLVGSDGWSSNELLAGAGDLLEGAVFTDHWHPDAPWPASRAFVTAYRERFKHDPSAIAALGHDAARLLADAVARAGADTPEAIRQALSETRDLAAATGTISMGKGGEPEKDVVLVRIEKRQFRYHTAIRPSAP